MVTWILIIFLFLRNTIPSFYHVTAYGCIWRDMFINILLVFFLLVLFMSFFSIFSLACKITVVPCRETASLPGHSDHYTIVLLILTFYLSNKQKY